MALWLSLWWIAAGFFLCFDMIWLLWLGRQFYKAEIGGMIHDRPKLGAAAAFYVLYVSGLVAFVIEPAYAAAAVGEVFALGALFGLVAYGTFDLTNLAILKGFTAKIAMIDLAWGAWITGATAALTMSAGRFILG